MEAQSKYYWKPQLLSAKHKQDKNKTHKTMLFMFHNEVENQTALCERKICSHSMDYTETTPCSHSFHCWNSTLDVQQGFEVLSINSANSV